MAKLSGQQFSQLKTALHTYFDRFELMELVRVHFETDLDVIVESSNLKYLVHQLIRWAERHDYVLKLLQSARVMRPNNKELAELAATFEAADRHDGQLVKMPVEQKPRYYLANPGLLATLRDKIFEIAVATSKDEAAKILALHGMGGIGKTVTAWALYNDPSLESYFRDGFLWVTLDRQKSVLAPDLQAIIECLGSRVTPNVSSTERLKGELAKLLKGKKCLFVLDDVWRKSQVESFLVDDIETQGCVYVITTRDAAIAKDMQAKGHIVKIFPIDKMTPDDAIQLLDKWAGGTLADADVKAKQRLVYRLGYLPLAVRLAGPQLPGRGIDAWLEAFNAKKLETHRVESLHDSLWNTLLLSLEEIGEENQVLYLALAIFRKDEPLPVVGIRCLWSVLKGLQPEETENLLRDLVDRALLEPHQRESGAARGAHDAVVLHDLLREMAERLLGKDRIQEMHLALLEWYRRLQTGDGWHTVVDDGYLYDHLVYHLEQVAETDTIAESEIRGLFVDDRWMRVRVSTSDHYDGYLFDLERSCRILQRALIPHYEGTRDDQLIVQIVAHTLIRTTINSLLSNYTPELVGHLIGTGIWSIERGSRIAARIASAERRALTYIAISQSGQCMDDQREQALRDSLTATCELKDDVIDDKISELQLRELLKQLIPLLRDEMREEVDRQFAGYIDSANGLATSTSEHELLAGECDETCSTESNIPLADDLGNLPSAVVREDLLTTLSMSLVVHDEGYLCELLTMLATQLQGAQKENVLQAYHALRGLSQDENEQASTVTELVPRHQAEVPEEPLDAVLAIEDDDERASALTSLAPFLRDDELTQAARAILAMEDEDNLAGSLIAFVPYLPGILLQECLKAVYSIEDEWTRLQTMLAMVPHIPVETREVLLQTVLADIAELDRDDGTKSRNLTFLSPHLTGESLKKGIEIAFSLKDKILRAGTLIALAANLPANTVSRIIDAVLEVDDTKFRLRSLAAVVPSITTDEQLHTVRSCIFGELYAAFADENRAAFLSYLATPCLLAPPLLSESAISAVADEIINITTRWRWL